MKHKALLENEIDLYLSNEMNRQTLNYKDTKQITEFFNEKAEDFNFNQHELFNMISVRPLKKMTDRDRDRINSQLGTFLKRRNSSELTNDRQFDQYLDYKRKLTNLPIHSFREELLDLIYDNQVIVISGETGW